MQNKSCYQEDFPDSLQFIMHFIPLYTDIQWGSYFIFHNNRHDLPNNAGKY